MKRSRIAAAVLVAVATALVLAGCTPIVAMDPAADSNNPSCADVIVRLPDTIEELPRRETNAQATAAWGDPSAVLLRCGVTVPQASTLQCENVDGVDWLLSPGQGGTRTFTTFGRDPAIDVVVDSDVVAPGHVLSDLALMVGFTPSNGLNCE